MNEFDILKPQNLIFLPIIDILNGVNWGAVLYLFSHCSRIEE